MEPSDLFPYPYRFDQKKASEKIYELALEGANIFFHAPTGYGKTVVVLAALLPIALEEDVPIIWSVRTGNETDRPIEEIKVISEKIDIPIPAISVRGKKDMCLLARERDIHDSEGVSVLCDKMKRKCRYYSALGKTRAVLEEAMTFSDLLQLAKQKRFCPYYYQLRLASQALVVSVNYNYVFSPYIQWALRSYVDFRDAILVVDEAHNLQHVISRINSDRITMNTVDRSINELREIKTKIALNYIEKVTQLKNVLQKEGLKILGDDDIFDPKEVLENAGWSEDDLRSARPLVSKIYTLKIAHGKSPRSSFRHLIDFFTHALENYRRRGVVFIKTKEKNQYAFEIVDMRAASVLRRVWRTFRTKIFMSGTLKPYKAFADIIGLRRYRVVTGSFEVPKENVRAIITMGLSTRGEELSEPMKHAYLSTLEEVLGALEGNTIVFFSSYRIMSELLFGLMDILNSLGKRFYIEKEGLRGDHAKRILKSFMEHRGLVLLANIAGRFSEGIDLPGEALENIIIIGIPFERLTIRTILYMEYYKELYGPEKGIYYSYVLPALRKVSQAMGRAIRSPNDRATIIAMDERYSEKRNLELLPEFFQKNAIKTKPEELIELLKNKK